MWMLEDMDYMRMMVDPLKKLSLDTLVDSINSKKDIAQEEIEVVFIPGEQGRIHNKGQQARYKLLQGYSWIYGRRKTTIEGKNLIEYIEEKNPREFLKIIQSSGF